MFEADHFYYAMASEPIVNEDELEWLVDYLTEIHGGTEQEICEGGESAVIDE